MARPLRITYPGAFYHVTSRGNEQRDVFKSKRDREKFLSYLESANVRYGAVVHAYCLMSNHYHFLLETPQGNLSQIMRHINGAYTTYFNIKRKRAGHLFQGRYKAILVEADAYAEELSRYIHLNPVRAAMSARPEEYPWSSYRHYISTTAPSAWLNTGFILGYFDNNGDNYRLFVEELIDKAYESPLKDTVASTVLGSSAFIEEITTTHLNGRRDEEGIPALRQMKSKPSPDEIMQSTKNIIDSDDKLARQLGMYLCHQHSGLKLKEIGEIFGMRESALCEASRRMRDKITLDTALQKQVKAIKDSLKYE
ncbi:MAG: transposase [Desulfobulbaceae bacterium]|nr:transposase [Desulfobulbaceae bacterium]